MADLNAASADTDILSKAFGIHLGFPKAIKRNFGNTLFWEFLFIGSGFEESSNYRKLSENLMFRLRLLDGMEISIDIRERFYKKICSLKNSGLLTKQNSFLKLTGEGVMLANCVFREFL